MDFDLRKQIGIWYEEEEYDKIIEAVENSEEQSYQSIVFLAGIYAKRGKAGDAEKSSQLLRMVEDIDVQTACAPARSAHDDGRVEVYEEEDLERLDEYISEHFGEFNQVFHEIVSLDIHLNVCIIPPEDGRNFYTLVTMGMGAHAMNLPAEYADMGLERAELMICLPEDWNLENEEEKWYWPVRLLKTLARLPVQEDGWLGWGHTIDYDKPFDGSTGLCGAILIDPVDFGDVEDECVLADGSIVNFYQIVPLYREELDFKQKTDAESLLKKLSENVTIVNPSRKNYCRMKMLS